MSEEREVVEGGVTMEGMCKATRAAYAEAADVLYVTCSPESSLSLCHSVEDTPSGMTVMRDAEGRVSGVEVCDFSGRFSIPGLIPVDSDDPFTISVGQEAIAM